jgi:N-acetylglucosaminyldiphosphoundecaprenol N-acetyl-beta-D-mannosaminyltransferase
MRLNAVKILKISVTNDSKKVILEELLKYLISRGQKQQKSIKIYTPNAEQMVMAHHSPDFMGVLNRADVAIPDSNGVVWAARLLTDNPPPVVIPGIDFMQDLAGLAEKCHVPIGLIGGIGNVAIGTLECLRQIYPGLQGWDTESIDTRWVAKKISEKKLSIVFVGLGAPRQEFFIEQMASLVPNGVIFMAVGGSFDVLSGRLPRAPVYFRNLGLEWFWRLILEPRRIFRQLALVEFVWMVIRQKLSD